VNDECFVEIPDDAKFDKFKLRSGDIVVSLTGNVGRIARIRDEHLPAALNQRVARVSPKSEEILNAEYLYFLLRSPKFLEFAIRSGKGAAQQNISTSDMEKFEVYIPSPTKQKEVVEKLDTAFTEIDKLEKNLDLSEDKVRELWQSVLRSTFTVQADFQDVGELSTNRAFREETIEEICNVEYGTRVVRKRDAGTLYPVYGGGGETFFIDSFNREDRVVIARFALSEKCTRRVLGKFALNDSGLTLSPKDARLLRQDYLDYFILSINDQIYESARGTAQKNLDVPAFRRMKIAYPASSELQMAIVKKLDSVFTEIEAMRNNLAIKNEQTIQLRRSLLHHAFNGFEEVA
jgi:restriction endonuclease S subunit